jgi:quercetin dioxygenase-like cupin family protein
MIKRTLEEIEPDFAFAKRPGWGGAAVRWAVSRDTVGSELGSVAWIEADPGEGYPIERYPDCERIVYVARGSGRHVGAGEPIALRAGDGVLVPKGAWHGFVSDGTEPVLLVALFAPYADVSQASVEVSDGEPESGPQVVRVAASEIDWDPTLDDDMGFEGLDVKWLVNGETAGAEHMLFGLSRFAPKGSHVLHRHPLVEEVCYVVDGRGVQLLDGEPFPVGAGELTFAARGEWHGHRADPDTDMHFLFLYLGKSTLEAAGYELHRDLAGSGS